MWGSEEKNVCFGLNLNFRILEMNQPDFYHSAFLAHFFRLKTHGFLLARRIIKAVIPSNDALEFRSAQRASETTFGKIRWLVVSGKSIRPPKDVRLRREYYQFLRRYTGSSSL